MEEGKLYRPSNGTEGEFFNEKFCYQCIHDHPDMDKDPKCDLILFAMCNYTTDPDYPKEWVYDENGQGICTKFQKWDWGNDDDPDGRNEPPPKEPDDPNQLCLPFEIDEILKDHKQKQEPVLV